MRETFVLEGGGYAGRMVPAGPPRSSATNKFFRLGKISSVGDVHPFEYGWIRPKEISDFGTFCREVFNL